MSRNMQTDEQLIEGCVAGKREFQYLLYKRYASKMLGVCMRYLKNREEAEDALQEGFLKVFDNIPRFRRESSLETWMRRIMVNTCLNLLRKAVFKHDHTDVDAADELRIETVDALSRLSTKELLFLVHKLPDGYRVVFNLFAIEGYSHKEISQELGISEGTSKSQFARARKALQQMIGQHFKAEIQQH